MPDYFSRVFFSSDTQLLCQSRHGIQRIHIVKNYDRVSETTLSPSLIYPADEPLYDQNESNNFSEAEAQDPQTKKINLKLDCED